MRFLFTFLLLLTVAPAINAQQNPKDHLIYIDKKGVMRFTGSGEEASFFGTNYTVPFAYGFRSLNYLNKKHEEAINEDVYHFSRLGFNAFRVHIWDVEIADSAGNLIDNEHLRLFDYLLNKLKEYNIRVFLTPIAFWGNGYPERDEKTPGFSTGTPKRQVLVNEEKIKAQENFIRQLCKHVNSLTKQTYGNDPNIIAMEINNEPHHSGPAENVTAYINRMVKSAKSTGWKKPIFYNISESPTYAKAVAEADIQGVSFQWYPTGLVANRTQKGNYLPNTHHYAIPFDTIAAFHNKARMIYEFDAGDITGSYMYPAMARSFRTAGFQWATQFAYDPMATAFANTEYQTHYVNLAYTPSKAISLMVASKVFHQLKRNGTPSNDTLFGPFHISYSLDLSEMVSDQTFIYSNSTTSMPPKPELLTQLAGVGSSPLIQYRGTGAYFLDKLSYGLWRLELMPDAVAVADPYERTSLNKTVTRINHTIHPITITIPDLGNNFTVQSLRDENNKPDTAIDKTTSLKPGVYIITAAGINKTYPKVYAKSNIPIATYFAPPANMHKIEIMHEPQSELTAGRPHRFLFTITGASNSDQMNLALRHSGGAWKNISLQQETPYTFSGTADSAFMHDGLINYQLSITNRDGNQSIFPGNSEAADFRRDISNGWESFVVRQGSPIELFNAYRDRNKITAYQPDWENGKIAFVHGSQPAQLKLEMSLSGNSTHRLFGFEFFTGKLIKQKSAGYTEIEMSASQQGGNLKIVLINTNGDAFSNIIESGKSTEVLRIPITEFSLDSLLLLPRPYPSFQPLYKISNSEATLDLQRIERIQLLFYRDMKTVNTNSIFTTEWIRFVK